MRKTSVILAACTVVLLATLLVPAVAAAPPKTSPAISPKAAEGIWTWVGTAWEVWKTTDKVKYFSGSEDGTWTGSFAGTSVDAFGGKLWRHGGGLWAMLNISFTGTVDDKTGTLEILTTADATDPDKPMNGTWTVTSGTGDLAMMRGYGTWYSDPDVGGARYSGILKEFVPPA